MEKEEMKKVLMALADEADELNPLLGMAVDYPMPYQVLEILTGGYSFWQYRTVSFVENVRVACASGQLTQREMPDKSGVYISVDRVKNLAKGLHVLAEMPYAKTEGIFSGYEEFLPLAEKIKEKAEILVQDSIKTVGIMEEYIGEAKDEPFKESWSNFSSGLAGLSQTLEAVVKHYGTKNDWASLVVNSIHVAQELSESLKTLGELYRAGEPVESQVKRVIEVLQEATSVNEKAIGEIEANATYEVRETYGYLTESLKNMKEII